MKYSSLFIISCYILFLTSCKNNQVEQKLIQLDSLHKVLIDIKKTSYIPDTSEYNVIYKKIKSTDNIFKKLSIKLPDDKNFMLQFTEYTQLEKGFKRIFKEYEKVQVDINFTQKQISDLKTDIQKNNIKERDKINTYISQESEAVKKIENKLNEIFTAAKSSKDSYYKLKENIESYAEILKNKK